MSSKPLLGFIALSLGVILILFSFHGLGHARQHRWGIVTDSPVSPTERVPFEAPTTAPDSGASLRFWLATGYTLILVGAAIAIRYREK